LTNCNVDWHRNSLPPRYSHFFSHGPTFALPSGMRATANVLGPVVLFASTLATAGEARPESVVFDPATYEQRLQEIDDKRRALGRRFEHARAGERAQIRAEARRTVLAALSNTIFPAWMGTPWGLGPLSTANRPHQPGMVVGCSYFLTGVLQNAGLRLEDRARFAQAPSALMQKALSSDPKDLHRLPGMDASKLEDRIRALGDGVYIVGLNIHTGFLLVQDGAVRIVHASYTPPNQVVSEPLAKSLVIRYSYSRGYVVTPVFRDDRLVDLWLTGRAVPAPVWPPR
jgi:hypothetical protein